MEPEKKNLKIFKEEVKIQHTSHWDWDYLTHAQIDSILKQARSETPDMVESGKRPRRRRVFSWALLLVGVTVAGIWVGYLLLR